MNFLQGMTAPTALRDRTTTIEEGAKGLRVLKAFGRGRHSFEQFDKQAVELFDTHISRIKLHTRFVWVLGALPDFMLGAVLLGGATAVGAGNLSIGELVAFVTYVLILVWPIEALGWILALGEEVRTIPGEGTNIKITYIEDALIADAILSKQRW